jgi:hypothetical protein
MDRQDAKTPRMEPEPELTPSPYCFVVSMILIFANPFWNHFIAQATGK